MIEAVVAFGLINVVFEFILISMMPCRMRLRMLGSKGAQTCMHVVIMAFVLCVHWGTLVGTMSGFFSFILSIVTITIARSVYGYIEDGSYHRRLIGYSIKELQ